MRIRALASGGVAVTVLALAAVTLPNADAAGATWTRITSPQPPGARIFAWANTTNNPDPKMTIAGTTSSDVTQVDIYCFYDHDERTTTSTPLNTGTITVTNGAIPATDVSAPQEEAPCILRAVPSFYTGLDGAGHNSLYVGAFSGPAFYTGIHSTYAPNGPVVSWIAHWTQQRAYNDVTSAGNYGVGIIHTVDDAWQVEGANALDGSLYINQRQAVAPGGTATRSGLVIDGHSAYLPAAMNSLAQDPSTIAGITVTTKRTSAGGLVAHERVPLLRCSNVDFTTTSNSCTPAPTGVALTRSITSRVGGAVLSIRDRFVDVSHHSHSIHVEYTNYLAGNQYGDWGVKLPGGDFRLGPTDQVKTMPVLPHTIYVTSDRYAELGDANRADTGFTYSAHPVVFFVDPSTHVYRYSRSIPKDGFAGFGFATETSRSWKTDAPWASAQAKAMREHLQITAPKAGATVQGGTVTVHGHVGNPVNGYPTKVTVTVGGVSKSVAVTSGGSFAATFSLVAGKHTVTAKTTDPSGIVMTRSMSFKVT